MSADRLSTFASYRGAVGRERDRVPRYFPDDIVDVQEDSRAPGLACDFVRMRSERAVGFMLEDWVIRLVRCARDQASELAACDFPFHSINESEKRTSISRDK